MPSAPRFRWPGYESLLNLIWRNHKRRLQRFRYEPRDGARAGASGIGCFMGPSESRTCEEIFVNYRRNSVTVIMYDRLKIKGSFSEAYER